jgi:protein DGCR14
MLLSPGHSPRQISSPSPSISENPTENPNNSSITVTPRNPRKRAAVLDEESYVAAIEKIVERDFFPDIPKLRDRLDWLEAVRSGDPVQIRDAQLKILERRGGKSSNPDASGKIRTPGSTFFRTATPLDLDKTPVLQSNDETLVVPQFAEDFGDVPFSLDEFFRRYTSEDNDSFSQILKNVNKRRKERYAYLLEGEQEDAKQIEHTKMDRITDGYGTSDQPPSTLEGWKFTAKNLLMYHPADNGEAPLTASDKQERLQALTREINRPNTRLHGKFTNSDPRDEDTVAVLYTPVVGGTPVAMSLADRYGDKLARYDLEDLKKTPNPFYVESNKKSDNGYSYIKTPSPAPGADGSSPFITWGEIEGTPLRLENEETPIDIGGSGSGTHFKIPLPPSRDMKAHSLSRDAAKKIRERSKMFSKPPLHSPARNGSVSPAGRRLSPAAQKFVRNAMAKSSHSGSVDESLRASYRGSSPGLGTPKSVRSMSRFGRDDSLGSRSPSVRDNTNPPW